MQKKAIELNAIIGSVRSKVDRSLSISLSTPELSPTDMAEIMNLQGINLTCLLTPLDEQDAPKYKVDKELERKSPSTRLRGVLFLVWKSGGEQGTFDSFYLTAMNNIIDKFKEKLD